MKMVYVCWVYCFLKSLWIFVAFGLYPFLMVTLLRSQKDSTCQRERAITSTRVSWNPGWMDGNVRVSWAWMAWWRGCHWRRTISTQGRGDSVQAWRKVWLSRLLWSYSCKMSSLQISDTCRCQCRWLCGVAWRGSSRFWSVQEIGGERRLCVLFTHWCEIRQVLQDPVIVSV